MFVGRTRPAVILTWVVALVAALVMAPPAAARDIDVDFLFNYYDQDGNRSPVTGGVGTEDLQVISPLVLLSMDLTDRWDMNLNLGVDSITSASTDNMDDVVSSASRQDARAFTIGTFTRNFDNQTLSLSIGLSTEYDYQSLNAGIGWSHDFNKKNTNLALNLKYYDDTIDLYDIDGDNQGEDARETIDLGVSLTQVLGPKTVGGVEFSYTMQEGFLSTPFHEVTLASTLAFPMGEHITERLPDSRDRWAVGFRLNHAFTPRFITRFYLRHYSDDWGIDAQTFEVEPHFRLPTDKEMWIYPILRYHTQSGSDYFVDPLVAIGTEEFLTADYDLSEFDSQKYGLGWRWNFKPGGPGRSSRLRNMEARLTSYERDDGFTALSASYGIGWRF